MVDCDASGTGFGTVLHGGEGPIAFFSCLVTSQHAKLVAYERELIGLVQAVRHWRPYLWTREFILRTDHCSLKNLLDSTLLHDPSPHLGEQTQVEYKPDKLNEPGIRNIAISQPEFELFDAFRHELLSSPKAITKK